MEASATLLPTAEPAAIRRVNQLYHDLTQATFDAEHRYRHRVEAAFWRLVARRLDVVDGTMEPPRLVVDLACGTGFVARILGRALRPVDRLMAIDVSTAALHTTMRSYATCREQTFGRLIVAAADGQILPLPSGSVDLFAINAALHHMPDPVSVLGEVDRVLKPGGLFALGFEPNSRHFASRVAGLSRGIDRLAWYASPRQNVRRAKARLMRSAMSVGGVGEPPPERIVAIINDTLLRERSVTGPLDAGRMLDLVDPHARGAGHAAGFDAIRLLRTCFVDYHIVRLFSSDYLGETPRRWRLVRGLIDGGWRLLLPGHGSLFSWVIRKPDGGADEGGVRPC
ncbi:MAG: class I SAM-dependent methyltransferase [Planctomycetes bacterium]|nr:class I SAM-dependent methyltransferase [Planctomycetota bacterium]